MIVLESLLTQSHALDAFQLVLWWMYLLAALVLPAYHVRPILLYLRGSSGIGDACLRTEMIQCAWRFPALLFSIFVVASLPLFLSVFLDMLGRIGRIAAMQASQRRWHARHFIQEFAATHGVHGRSRG